MDVGQYRRSVAVSLWTPAVSTREKSSEAVDTTRLGFRTRYRVVNDKLHGGPAGGNCDIDRR